MTSSSGFVNLTIKGRNDPASPNSLCTHRVLPNLECASAQQSIVHRLQKVPAETKEILCKSM
jgi:hypothetical protein